MSQQISHLGAWGFLCSQLLLALLVPVNASDRGLSEPPSSAALGVYEPYAVLSDFWPEKITLTVDLETKGFGRKGVTAVLLGVDGREVIGDFGRHGIHSIPLSDTDFAEHFETNQRAGERQHGLFSGIMYNKFFKVLDGEVVQCSQADFSGKDYFVLVRKRLSDDRTSLIKSELESLSSKLKADGIELELAIFPTDETEEAVTQSVRERSIHSPVLYHFLSKSYGPVYFLDGPTEQLRLIDRNGRALLSAPVEGEAELKLFFEGAQASIVRDQVLKSELMRVHN